MFTRKRISEARSVLLGFSLKQQFKRLSASAVDPWGESGSVALEAAIVLPILVFMAIGIFQISLYMTAVNSTLSGALVASQNFAASRGGSGTALAASKAAVDTIYCSTIPRVPPNKIKVYLYVANPGDPGSPPSLCSTCTGSGTSLTCPASAGTASTTCSGTCESALNAAAPDPATGKYYMSSAKVETECTWFNFLGSLPLLGGGALGPLSLACPVSSQISGVVQ